MAVRESTAILNRIRRPPALLGVNPWHWMKHMTSNLLSRVRAAVYSGWRAEAAVHPGGEVAELDGLLCHTTGIPVLQWNGVHVLRVPADPATALRASRTWFADRQLEYAVLIPVELEPALALACAGVGLRQVGVQPQMALRASEFTAAPVPPELVVEDATDSAAAVTLAAECFGDPPAETERFVAPYLTHPDWTLLLGYVDGTPVSTATLMRQGPHAAGVYGVATTSAYRQRGYGAALTSLALRREFDNQAGAPEPIAHLNPSPTAEGMYARMGFRSLPGWAIWAPERS